MTSPAAYTQHSAFNVTSPAAQGQYGAFNITHSTPEQHSLNTTSPQHTGVVGDLDELTFSPIINNIPTLNVGLRQVKDEHRRNTTHADDKPEDSDYTGERLVIAEDTNDQNLKIRRKKYAGAAATSDTMTGTQAST